MFNFLRKLLGRKSPVVSRPISPGFLMCTQAEWLALAGVNWELIEWIQDDLMDSMEESCFGGVGRFGDFQLPQYVRATEKKSQYSGCVRALR